MRPEPHPTRHEREHPSDEPDWHKKNEPYDPISELIGRVAAEEIFKDFVNEYFNEADAPNPVMDKEIDYTNTKGEKKKIKVKAALRLPKDHPAHIQASKLVGPDDAPANEPKKKENPAKDLANNPQSVFNTQANKAQADFKAQAQKAQDDFKAQSDKAQSDFKAQAGDKVQKAKAKGYDFYKLSLNAKELKAEEDKERNAVADAKAAGDEKGAEECKDFAMDVDTNDS
jgi:hypothetical protein